MWKEYFRLDTKIAEQASNLSGGQRQISFEIPKNSFVSIVGESGCGKSTLD